MTDDHIKALDLVKQDQWEQAHETIQKTPGPLACEIHGYLHRVEGDFGNASYWYSRAGKELPRNTLDEEHARLLAKAQAGSK